jgi:hypothetical protein
MKKTSDLSSLRVSDVTVDPSLDQYHGMFPEQLAKAKEMLKTSRLPARVIRTLMTNEQVEATLSQLAVGDNYPYPVRLSLASGRVLAGFEILENAGRYILGRTLAQREASVGEAEIIGTTLVAKDKLVSILCPELDFQPAD